MERKVGVLSGGELQRLAIAVAYCKDADLYYFDEPAAYLDVSQRLAASKALKELSGQKNVVVVEHDLAIFDYLSDYVHVLYGQENAYGVVSGVKGARSGINEYLQGYLREENVRFRNHEISFSVASATASRSKAVKFAYPALQKAYDSFSFSSKEGSIMEGEIIGMLGQNALGKSIFIKMIAGVEQPDNTSLAHLLRISYKPQYVKAEEGVEVQQMFSGPGLNMAFSESARRRLNVNSLMDKKLDSLSGGELQRVACALALSREADMYLFDEPSAFMDIEQRLEFSNLLQSLMSEGRKAAFVIDHDLLMLDSLSSRLITFDGKPASSGGASSPLDKREGMNSFLKTVGITLRRDKDSRRPRINKPDSALDREQKAAGEYYYYEN
jgi:ATP-binding cassette subfamily E protein 1